MNSFFRLLLFLFFFIASRSRRDQTSLGYSGWYDGAVHGWLYLMSQSQLQTIHFHNCIRVITRAEPYALSLPSRSLATIIAFKLLCPVLTWLFAPDCPRTSQPSPLFTRCASRVTSVKLAAILLSQAVAHSRRGPAIGVQVQSTIMPDKIVRITKLSSAEGRAVCASCSVNAPNVVDTLDLEDLDRLVLSTRSGERVSKPGSAQ